MVEMKGKNRIRLQNIFSLDDFKNCLEKIKHREYFDITLIHKPYKFSFKFQYCDNGLWKNNLMLSVGADYKEGGYSHSMQLDELPKDYGEFCKRVNDYWLGEEKWYGDYKEIALENQITMFDY